MSFPTPYRDPADPPGPDADATAVIPRIGPDWMPAADPASADTAVLDRQAIARAVEFGTDPSTADTVVLRAVTDGAAPSADGDTVVLEKVRTEANANDRPAGRIRSHARAGRGGSAVRTTLRVTGELMITFGLVLLLFASYEVWGKSAIVDAHQRDLDAALDNQWDDPTVSDGTVDPNTGEVIAPPGAGVARLYLPRLGKHWVVVEGVDDADIEYAPGHYPGTAGPGQVGNFSVAGHRIPAIFWDLDLLRKDDAVVVETAHTWYIYRVTQVRVVSPTAVEVVAPVPGQPGVSPTVAMLTMTTCNPKLDNYQRLIVHAQLDHTQDRDGTRPPELDE